MREIAQGINQPHLDKKFTDAIAGISSSYTNICSGIADATRKLSLDHTLLGNQLKDSFAFPLERFRTEISNSLPSNSLKALAADFLILSKMGL